MVTYESVKQFVLVNRQVTSKFMTPSSIVTKECYQKICITLSDAENEMFSKKELVCIASNPVFARPCRLRLFFFSSQDHRKVYRKIILISDKKF